MTAVESLELKVQMPGSVSRELLAGMVVWPWEMDGVASQSSSPLNVCGFIGGDVCRVAWALALVLVSPLALVSMGIPKYSPSKARFDRGCCAAKSSRSGIPSTDDNTDAARLGRAFSTS